MAKKKELRLEVTGDRRSTPDSRRMARAILRHAVELDVEQAQQLADVLEHEEALQRKAGEFNRSSRRRHGSGRRRCPSRVSVGGSC